MKRRPRMVVSAGAAAFKLYDTFGLAIDEQEEMARELASKSIAPGSTSRWSGSASVPAQAGKAGIRHQSRPSIRNCNRRIRRKFNGYDTLEHYANVIALLRDNKLVEELPPAWMAKSSST